MNDAQPVTLREEDVPTDGIVESLEELVDLYGGTIEESTERRRRFILPLRRGISSGGGVQCTLEWSEGERAAVALTCDRNVDAPKAQRVLMLAAGVAGALLFTIWPFLPHPKGNHGPDLPGTLAWIGAAIAISVYFLSLRKTSGGLAYDFLHRLVGRQRAMAEPEGG